MATLTTDDGTTLYYEESDPGGDAPAVVFLNGMTQSTQNWVSQVDRFEADFRVLTYDARGQGRSELGEAPLSMELHLADLQTLVDHLDLDQPHVVGFSHGARVALGFAAHHPDRVRRLVLCSLSAEPTALARTIVESWEQILDLGGLEAMSWAAIPNILGDAYLDQNEHILEGIVRAAVRRNSEEGVRALLEAMEKYPPLAEMADAVDAETLVLSAADDLLVDRAGAEELARRCGGEHRQVPNVGHTIPIEAPDAFHERVSTFLTGSSND